jgi:hypothetical protein
MKVQSKIAISPRAMFRSVGDETVILDLETGSYFGLDPVGARVWALIDEGKAFDELCETMVEEYEVNRAQLERDVEALVNNLANHRLISIRNV